jgi:hypothetical protein
MVCSLSIDGRMKHTRQHGACFAVLIFVLCFLLSCGHDHNNPPPASLQYLDVYISEPSDQAYLTSNSVFMRGGVKSEVQYSYQDCPLVRNADIVVTWRNITTQAIASVNPFWDQACVSIWGTPFYCFCFQSWEAGYVPLTMGSNVLQATAVWGALHSTYTITVTRGQ